MPHRDLVLLLSSSNLHDRIAGVGQMAFDSLELFVSTPEAKEGVAAFNEKRPTDFSPYR